MSILGFLVAAKGKGGWCFRHHPRRRVGFRGNMAFCCCLCWCTAIGTGQHSILKISHPSLWKGVDPSLPTPSPEHPLSPSVNKLNIWGLNKKEADVNLSTSFLPPQQQIPGFFAHLCHLITGEKVKFLYLFPHRLLTSSCLLGEGARSKASY